MDPGPCSSSLISIPLPQDQLCPLPEKENRSYLIETLAIYQLQLCQRPPVSYLVLLSSVYLDLHQKWLHWPKGVH